VGARSPAAFISDSRGFYRARSSSEGGPSEALLPAGTYDVVTWMYEDDSAHIAIREGVSVNGLSELEIAPEELRNSIKVNGKDEESVPLASRPRTTRVSTYQNRLRLVYPSTNAIAYFDTSYVQASAFRITDLPASWQVLLGEFYMDSSKDVSYSIQYPALQSVSGDLVLDSPPLQKQEVRVETNPREGHYVELGNAKHDRYPGRWVLESLTTAFRPVTGAEWRGNIYLTPDAHPNYGFSPSIGLRSQTPGALTEFDATPLRVVDGRTGVFYGTVSSPGTQWISAGNLMTFGGGPLHPHADFAQISPTALHVHMFFHGPHRERRWRDGQFTRWESFSAEGTSTGTGGFQGPDALIPLRQPGLNHIEFRNQNHRVGNVDGRATLRISFDSTLDDGEAASFTGLNLRDANGDQVTDVEPGDEVWLWFGAADWVVNETGRHYKPIKLGATTTSYRVAGTSDWTPLDVDLVVEDIIDPSTAGRQSDGAIYRARIPAGADLPAGSRIDLQITIEDAAGNVSLFRLEPGLVAGTQQPSKRSRRRAAGN
jgi:hypothetical protein